MHSQAEPGNEGKSFPARVRMKPRLSRLGYRTVRLTNNTLFGKAGVILHGHEFDYSELDKEMNVDKVYQFADNRREGYRLGNTLGSYVHLHFGNTPDAVRNFLNLCKGSCHAPLTGLTQINWKFLKVLDYFQYPPEGYKCLKTWGTAGVTYERGVFLPQKTRKLPLRH